MKKRISGENFKSFIEKIPIVKKCDYKSNDEAVIRLNNDNQINVKIIVADTGYPKQIMELIAGYKHKLYCVILAPYISEQTASICIEAGFGYLDMAGNCNIACDSLYIEIKGNKNENVSKRALKSIYEKSSVVSSIILRVMLEDVNRVWRMKELADAASCSIGQVAKVKDFLANQAYIEQSAQGIRIIKPEAILKDWADVYSKSDEENIACYSLADIPALEEKIARMKEEIGVTCALTGFSGGSRYQPVVRYMKLHAYVNEGDIAAAMKYLGLKKVDSGANVTLIVKYNECVELNSKEVKGNMVVSPVQVYLDLMGIKGRGEEMAEAIFKREICR